MSNKKLLLIDGDALTYQCSKETLEESIKLIDERVENIFNATEADYYKIFLSIGTYFRHKIDPSYKSNRKKQTSPLYWVKTLKHYLIEKYNAVAGKDVEADDLCAYYMNKQFYYGTAKINVWINVAEDDKKIITQYSGDLVNPKPVDTILVSPDKDLLESIGGSHFNYSYKLLDKTNPDSLIKGWWVVTSKEEAELFKLYQLIAGDTNDGVKGIEGKGKKFFEKLE